MHELNRSLPDGLRDLIKPNKNYERLGTDKIFTGQQVLNLLRIAKPEMQIAILASIVQTSESPSKPGERYGI